MREIPKNIIRRIKEIEDRMKPNPVLVLFDSGHGPLVGHGDGATIEVERDVDDDSLKKLYGCQRIVRLQPVKT